MRGLVFVETDTGFILQGTSVTGAGGSTWGESIGQAKRETITLQDDDVGPFMDQALARRGQTAPEPTPKHYEAQLRVIGRYLDEHRPRDVFFFEIDGAYILRLAAAGQGGLKHELVEFTSEDITEMISNAPGLRRSTDPKAKPA